MDMNIVKLAVDNFKGTAVGNYSKSEDMEILRQALIEANHGKASIDPRDVRDCKLGEMFALIETIVQKVSEEGLLGNEFVNNYVEERNVKLGDSPVFHIEDRTLYHVDNIAEGTKGVRRQKIEGGQDVTVKTKVHAVKIYDDINRFLAGRIDMNTFIERVGRSFTQHNLNEIYAAFAKAMENVQAPYKAAGTFDEDQMLDVVDHIEAATGTTATIIGTRAALRKMTNVVMSSEAKSDLYNLGYFGKFNGVPIIAVKQRHKVGSTDFILPNDKLYVFGGDGDRFIKRVTEGETYVELTNLYDNQDLTQEYTMIQRDGFAIVMGSEVGVYELS